MYGAIFGDKAGSIYEFKQFSKVSLINVKELVTAKSFISDDTLLTMSILEAILNNCSYENSLKKYGKKYHDYLPPFQPYFKTTFSPSFTKWVSGSEVGFSSGNGAMMRISPVGYLFDDEKSIRENVRNATIPSHNSDEAIESATTVAMIIFLARKGLSKQEIINKLNLNFSYQPFSKFNLTCGETLDNCLYALFNSNSFEEALRTVISYGGDTDTNACIVGAMAEALYGMDKRLVTLTQENLPEEFVEMLHEGYKKIKILK